MKGYFITFEGGEGVGKTTLIQSLSRHFTQNGREVLITHEPGGSDLGKPIREILLNQTAISITPKAELFLFLADRAQHVEGVIRPALEAGKIVLCDRFTDSTLAYQGAARKLDFDQINALCNFATSSLQPNLTLLLDLDPDVGLHRISSKHDRIESEKNSFHQRVRKGYHQLAQRDPDRVKVIDASLSKEEVFTQALFYADV